MSNCEILNVVLIILLLFVSVVCIWIERERRRQIDMFCTENAKQHGEIMRLNYKLKRAQQKEVAREGT